MASSESSAVSPFSALEQLQATQIEALETRLERAAFVAERLFQMIPEQAWRDSGGDDGQGHYEGDYRAAQTLQEIKSWAK